MVMITLDTGRVHGVRPWKYPAECDNKDMGCFPSTFPRTKVTFRGRSDVSRISRPGHHPPPLLPRLRRRRRQDRAGLAAGRTRSAAARRPRRRRTRCAPKPPHFAPKAKRGHPPVHGRRAQPARPVRLQAGAGEARRQAAARRRSSTGQRYAFIRPDAAVLGPRFKFAQHGQCGAELSEMLPHLARGRRRHLRSSSRCTPTSSTTPRRRSSSTPASSQPGPAEHGLVGHLRPGLRDAATCPAFVVMSTGGGHQRRRGQLVERLPADRLHRASGSATRATRSSNVASPAGHRRAAAARLARPDRRR